MRALTVSVLILLIVVILIELALIVPPVLSGLTR